jgi:hypothetical protein
VSYAVVTEGKKKKMTRNEVEREMKWAMKQKNLRLEEAVNRQVWEKRLRISNQCNTGTLRNG